MVFKWYILPIGLAVFIGVLDKTMCSIFRVTEQNYQQYFKVKSGSLFLYVTRSEDCELCDLLYFKFVAVSQIFAKYKDISFGHVNDAVLAEAFGVTSFPGIVYYAGGSASPSVYEGDITPTELTKFIASQTKKDLKKIGVRYTVGLTSMNFQDIMNTDKQPRLVLLHANDDLIELDEFDEIAEAFENEVDIVLCTINVDKQKRLTHMFLANKYPVLYWYPKGTIDDKKRYGGSLNVKGMVDYINNRCGLFRTKDGSLNSIAGLIEPLDLIVKEHVKDLYSLTNLPLIKLKLTKEIAKLPVQTDLELAEFYVHLIEEVEEDKTVDSLSETRNRLYRYMIDAGPFQLDQLKRKKNIVQKTIDVIGNYLNEIQNPKRKKKKKKEEEDGDENKQTKENESDHVIEFHEEF